MDNFFEEYKNLVYSILWKLCGNKEWTESLFQEVWVTIAENYDKMDTEKKVVNWVYTITLNCYRKRMRKETYQKKHRQEVEDLEQATKEIHNKENYVDASERLIIKERRKQVVKAIQQLSYLYQEPLVLFYYQECSYEEISEILSIPLSTVKYRLFRAKKKIKQWLEESERNERR